MSNNPALSAEDIVRGLLATAEILADKGGGKVSEWLKSWMEIAAAKITELNDFQSSQCAKLMERVTTLESQLAASQQETRAAVEYCKAPHYGDGDYYCGIDAACKEVLGILCGPQEAEKGDLNEEQG